MKVTAQDIVQHIVDALDVHDIVHCPGPSYAEIASAEAFETNNLRIVLDTGEAFVVRVEKATEPERAPE